MGTRLAKVSGTLQEMSGEELARQQGLSAAPPTPLSQQGLGASQDVAKMAGTPNQIRAMVQNSLQERTRTRDLLGESERSGARRRYTVDSLQERMNVLEGLGSLSNRVPEYVRTQLRTAGTVAVPNTVNPDAVATHLASVGITDAKAVTAAIEALDTVRLGTATPKDITEALAALKIEATITDDTTSLAEKFQKFFSEAGVDDIKKQMASVLQNYSDVKMKELPDVIADFANQQNNLTDVPVLLGLSDEAFGELTLGQVQAQLKAWKNRNFQDVDALRSVLEDPTYSISEKDFARERLAEMGAIGVTSIEQKAENLEAQVAAGDTVVVGGVVVKVSEIMSDPKLKAVVASALESPEELAKLQKTDADLAKWISNNKKALVKVRNELLAGTKKFADTQKEFSDKLGDAGVTHKAFLDSVIPGWNKAKGIGWTDWLGSPAAAGKEATGLYKDSPTIAYTLSMTDTTKRGYALSALSKLTPAQAKQFSTTSLDQIAAAATSDIEAQQFMDAYTKIATSAWAADINPNTTAVAFDADFTQADFDAVAKEHLEAFAPEFGSVKALVDEINRLKDLGPKERLRAVELSGVLANIKGKINQNLTPSKITQTKEKNKLGRQKKDYGNSVKFVDDAIGKVMNSLSQRGGDWLGSRGAEQFGKIKSAMATIRAQAAEGTISYEEARKKTDELKGAMAGELAAFVFDENHRTKSPRAALDAVQLLMDNGLKESLNLQQRESLSKLLMESVGLAMLVNAALFSSNRATYEKEYQRALRLAQDLNALI